MQKMICIFVKAKFLLENNTVINFTNKVGVGPWKNYGNECNHVGNDENINCSCSSRRFFIVRDC